MTTKKWPTISVSDDDRRIIDEIKKNDGPLHFIQQKDLLLIAAALALTNDAPEDLEKHSGSNDVIHAANLNSSEYQEYRQYILMIYYFTRANKDLKLMRNIPDIVKNFVDYVHRGLLFLKVNYVDNSDVDTQMLEEFAELLAPKS